MTPEEQATEEAKAYAEGVLSDAIDALKERFGPIEESEYGPKEVSPQEELAYLVKQEFVHRITPDPESEDEEEECMPCWCIEYLCDDSARAILSLIRSSNNVR
jgi:hypothetical protein